MVKQMNTVQTIGIKVWKYKAAECLEIQLSNVGTCSLNF